MDELEKSQPLVLDDFALQQLKETRKWSHFLSVGAFVVIGFMALSVISFFGYSSVTEGEFGALVALLPMMLILLVYYFPIYYLYRFSKFARQALDDHDPLALNQALLYLKMHYRYMGILIVVVFAFYVILGIFAWGAGTLGELLG
ncbi:MAG TPA: hypothetical protein VNI52_07895 [Sphingobacteriaceae bacterium]|nr:hypothetical protein [Sphingobacteriaceae bacterium]